MPRYNVEADGKWACYSSISDGFITLFMPRKEYEHWRNEEYGASCTPLESANCMSLKEAIYNLSLNKSDVEIISCLKEAGLIETGERKDGAADDKQEGFEEVKGVADDDLPF